MSKAKLDHYIIENIQLGLLGTHPLSLHCSVLRQLNFHLDSQDFLAEVRVLPKPCLSFTVWSGSGKPLPTVILLWAVSPRVLVIRPLPVPSL